MSFHVPSPEALQIALNLDNTPVYVQTGGFKAVYKINTPSGYEALKAVFIPSSGGDPDFEGNIGGQLFARAEREIEALGNCSIPSLVKLGTLPPILLQIEENDYLVYSEEFLLGEPLVSWIRRDPRPTYDELHGVFNALIDVIDILSGKGFLHRDFKPDNVMATGLSDRPFVVLDLGIAFKMHATELTQGGGPPGTLRYMAPELLKPDYKDIMDFRCDLYAAGLTIYVVASGVHPFAPNPENPYATVFQIFNHRPVRLAQLRPDLPIDFCKIIDRCIRKKPALRYANLGLVRRALEEVA